MLAEGFVQEYFKTKIPSRPSAPLSSRFIGRHFVNIFNETGKIPIVLYATFDQRRARMEKMVNTYGKKILKILYVV